MKRKLACPLFGSLLSVVGVALPAQAATSYAFAEIIDVGNVAGPVREFSTSGGHITATRAVDVGVYTFSFAGMFNPNIPHTLQVSMPGDSSVVCAPTSEGSSGSDFIVLVRCNTTQGQPAWLGPSAPLSIVYRMDSSTTAEVAGYARNAGNTLTTSWNSRGGANSMTHPSLGHYSFTFGGLPSGDSGGTAMVSTRTPGTRCAITSWGSSQLFSFPFFKTNYTVNVVCTATSTSLGSFADASLSVYFGMRPIVPAASFGWGFAWANDPGNPGPYPVSSGYQKTSNGQAVTARRSGPGQYSVVFPGLTIDVPFVNTYGDSDTVCSGFHLPQLPGQVDVQCRQNGALVDSRFVIETISP